MTELEKAKYLKSTREYKGAMRIVSNWHPCSDTKAKARLLATHAKDWGIFSSAYSELEKFLTSWEEDQLKINIMQDSPLTSTKLRVLKNEAQWEELYKETKKTLRHYYNEKALAGHVLRSFEEVAEPGIIRSLQNELKYTPQIGIAFSGVFSSLREAEEKLATPPVEDIFEPWKMTAATPVLVESSPIEELEKFLLKQHSSIADISEELAGLLQDTALQFHFESLRDHAAYQTADKFEAFAKRIRRGEKPSSLLDQIKTLVAESIKVIAELRKPAGKQAVIEKALADTSTEAEILAGALAISQEAHDEIKTILGETPNMVSRIQARFRLSQLAKA